MERAPTRAAADQHAGTEALEGSSDDDDIDLFPRSPCAPPSSQAAASPHRSDDHLLRVKDIAIAQPEADRLQPARAEHDCDAEESVAEPEGGHTATGDTRVPVEARARARASYDAPVPLADDDEAFSDPSVSAEDVAKAQSLSACGRCCPRVLRALRALERSRRRSG